MSNNKQSSLDYYITKLTEILGPEIIKQISRDDNERIARLERKAKAMHKELPEAKPYEFERDQYNPEFDQFSQVLFNHKFYKGKAK